MGPTLEERVHGLMSKGDMTAALKEVDAAIAQTPRDGEALRLRASLHALSEDWRAVVADLSALVSLQPKARLGGALAHAYKRAGDRAAARAEYDREIAADPEDPYLLRLRAKLRRDGGDCSGARADLLEAVGLKTDDGDLLCELADLEAGLGLDDEALGRLDAAVEASGHWRHRLNRGVFRVKLCRWAEAENDLDAVIFDIADAPALAGLLQQALFYRAWAKLSQGKRDALDDLDASLRINPKDPQALCLRGGMRAMAKDARAREDLEAALDLDPELALAYGFRGDLFLDAGDKASALSDYRKATDLEPSLRAMLAENIARAERAG